MWWITPIIGGGFALLGAAITLTVNFLMQRRRDNGDARRKEFEMARDWAENALACGGAAYRWVQKQETPTMCSPISDVAMESLALVESLSSVGETLELFVPPAIQESAREFCLQSVLLCVPVWNENGYAAQKGAYLEARSTLISEVRNFGGLEATLRDRVKMPTYAEARSEAIAPLLPGLRSHLEFRGLSAEDADEVVRRLAVPSESTQTRNQSVTG